MSEQQHESLFWAIVIMVACAFGFVVSGTNNAAYAYGVIAVGGFFWWRDRK